MPVQRRVVMTGKMFQFALCTFLSPLLVAQQSATVHIPKDTKIEMVALEVVSSNTAIVGMPVRFAVAKDVVVDGVTVFPVGTPVTGAVSKVVRGVPGRSEGFLRIRVREISRDGGVPLRLTSADPRFRQSRRDRFNEGAVNTLETLGGLVLLPLELPMAIAMSAGENGKPSGKNAVLPRCFHVDYWTAVSSTRAPGFEKNADQAIAVDQETCISGQERPQIDWSVSGDEHLTVE